MATPLAEPIGVVMKILKAVEGLVVCGIKAAGDALSKLSLDNLLPAATEFPRSFVTCVKASWNL